MRREHERRRKADQAKISKRRFDLCVKECKVSAGLSGLSKLALANARGSSAVRSVELLNGQHTSYFGQNPRAIRQLRELRDGGAISLYPALEEAAESPASAASPSEPFATG